MLIDKDIKYIAKECGVLYGQVKSVVELLLEGNTVPFISRYRKERTNNLDEEKVNRVNEEFEFINELNDRKATILKTIEGQNKLTDELKLRIGNIYSKTELEDIYLPYKPKRRTKATIAKEKGLEPLAELILNDKINKSAEELAKDFVIKEKGVKSIEDALLGAGHIIAEIFSENLELRKNLRNDIANKGVLKVTVTKDFNEKRTKFEQYYDYSENIKSIPSHRLLAIQRGESEKILNYNLEMDSERLQKKLQYDLFSFKHKRRIFLEEVFTDALKRLLLPSIKNDILKEKKKVADEEAIGVFASNMEKLLLAPIAGNLRLIAIDPGFRTGCKVVVLDETGKLIDNTTIFPNKPQSKIEDAKKTIKELIDKYKIEAIAIGNGTASRETHSFIKEFAPKNIIIMVVSEAGASVYSASKEAREEFPNYDVTVRGAISIGRRFSDPLSELVKIDPKSIGVGQYQHDVNQSLLGKKLDTIVESVVNRVGVEINTASYHLLKYVSGISKTLAKNIVEYRDMNGKFELRKTLSKVPKFGAKAFEQSAGFLRIRDGKNPLDATGIHPESYSIVEDISKDSKTKVEKLILNKKLLSEINANDFITDDFGIHTIKDIIEELEKPGRDPREDFKLFEFEDGVENIDDLYENMDLKGVITNVTNFGAFVDIGVHQDGLVHISELSNTFITNPEKIVSVGDKVRVKIIKVDKELKRIQLSMKALMAKPAKPVSTQSRPKKKQKNNSVNNTFTKKKTHDSNNRNKPKTDAIAELKKKWG